MNRPLPKLELPHYIARLDKSGLEGPVIPFPPKEELDEQLSKPTGNPLFKNMITKSERRYLACLVHEPGLFTLPWKDVWTEKEQSEEQVKDQKKPPEEKVQEEKHQKPIEAPIEEEMEQEPTEEAPMEEEDIQLEEPRQEKQKNLPYYTDVGKYTDDFGMKYRTYNMKENTRPFDLAKALGVDCSLILKAIPNRPYHKPRRMTAYSKLKDRTLLYVPEVIDLTLD